MIDKEKRRQMFRARILGNAPPPPPEPAYKLIALPASPLPGPKVKPVVCSYLDDVDGDERYFNEAFVRGKIENWAGRPAGGGQSHPLVVSEAMAAQLELRRGSLMPVDHTDADITSMTLVSLTEPMSLALIWFHTSNRRMAEIAKEVGVSYTECRRLLVQGHVDFSEEWERQKHRLNAGLRSLAPEVDPSRDAVPMVAEERPKPEPGPVHQIIL